MSLRKREVIMGTIALLVALSAIFSSISNDFDNRSQKLLSLSLLEFERLSYIENMQINSLLLYNGNSLDQNLDYLKKEYFCSLTILYYHLNNEFAEKNYELLEKMTLSCLNLSDMSEYEHYKSLSVNNSAELLNISKSLDPLGELNENLNKINKFQDYSSYFLWGSWISFLIALFIFEYYLLNYFSIKKWERLKTSNNKIK